MTAVAWRPLGRGLVALAAAVAAAGTPAAPFFSVYKDSAIEFDWEHEVLRTRVSGTLRPLAEDIRAAGARTVTLAFANGECGDETWAGAQGPAVARANLPLLVAADIDYVVSTGGQGGLFTCGSAAGMEAFVSRWESAHLVGIDYDIEEGQTQAQVDDLVRRAIEQHAARPALRFSFTIAVEAPNAGAPDAIAGLGTGRAQADPYDPLGDVGHRVMDSAARLLGWDGTAASWPSWITLDLMTMDYGDRPRREWCVLRGARCQMGESAVQSAYDLESAWRIPASAIELTPMIARNDFPDEVFRLEDVDRVSAFAIAEGLAGVHTWSWDRDAPCAMGKAKDTCNSLGERTARYGYLQRFLKDGLGGR